MNIIEKEARLFGDDLYSSEELNNLSNLKSKVSLKILDFYRDRDRLDFLKVLRKKTLLQQEEHLKKCKKLDCDFMKEREIGLFVIDQEIDEVNKYYTFDAKPNYAFTSEEESNLHAKLNEVIKKLEDLGIGQEIIFEEIESLKDNFNLGKKLWFQLLKGKLMELLGEKILNETIVKEIYITLTDGFSDFVKLLNK